MKKNLPKNIIFPKGVLLYCAKKAVFVIKSWGFLKNLKLETFHIHAEAYQYT
jgi:hypothetical protein